MWSPQDIAVLTEKMKSQWDQIFVEVAFYNMISKIQIFDRIEHFLTFPSDFWIEKMKSQRGQILFFPILYLIVLIDKIEETFRNKLKQHFVSKIGLTFHCLN